MRSPEGKWTINRYIESFLYRKSSKIGCPGSVKVFSTRSVHKTKGQREWTKVNNIKGLKQ